MQKRNTVILSLQRCSDIKVQTEALLFNLAGGVSLPLVNANILCLRVLLDLPPKGIFDNPRRVRSNTQFQIQNGNPLKPAGKLLIPPGCLIPAGILHKGIVTAEIHGHRRAADRTPRHKLFWNF